MRNLFLKKLTVLSAAACFTTAMWAQKQDVPRGWHLMDLQKDGYYGISLDKAYDFLKAKKIKSKRASLLKPFTNTGFIRIFNYPGSFLLLPRPGV